MTENERVKKVIDWLIYIGYANSRKEFDKLTEEQQIIVDVNHSKRTSLLSNPESTED